jgi:peptidoglycan hydrolase CwlO-like protein
LASQGAHKATVTNLQNQLESLQSQLFTAQSELTQQRAMYNQIKYVSVAIDVPLAL